MEDSFLFNQQQQQQCPNMGSILDDLNSCMSAFTENPSATTPLLSSCQFQDSRWMTFEQQNTMVWTSTLVPNSSNQISCIQFGGSEMESKGEAWSCNSSTVRYDAVEKLQSTQGAKKIMTTTAGGSTSRPSCVQVQDHILAERKRRENLTQRFTVLSALIPGLKKTDRASVLGHGVKYMKQMQEKVKALEEQTKKKNMESVVIVKKHDVYTDSISSSTSDIDLPVTEPFPEINIRLSNNEVLVNIHMSWKTKGALEKTIFEIEKHRLSVFNNSVMSFGDSVMNITIIAKKNGEFGINNVKELVKNLRCALEQF